MNGRRTVLMPAAMGDIAMVWAVVLAILVVSDEVLFNIALVFGALIWTFFHYVPERAPIIKADDTVISPVDGVIESVEESGEKVTISIRKGIWDSSAVWAPVTGEMIEAHILHGLFLPLDEPLSKRLNEQGGFRYRWGENMLRMQLRCGTLAWKLPIFATPGAIAQGDLQGQLIQGVVFVEIPKTIRREVAPGERVMGGVSVIARA